ncbi:MAG TPA: xanthine dehydrogenase family protein subunit M [Luteimonas sp.]|nr:xanthine dehydrogenase family protein subunit M [Luteimonas sp.]
MNPVSYLRARDVDGALAAIGKPLESSTAQGDARFIAGGTNLTDLMKVHVMRPARLVDISRLELARIEPLEDGGLRLGALARNADTAYHPLVRTGYPLLSSAILAGASPQIRNMASNGGNLLQRTRCLYFYDLATPCNKRQPGSGCSAIGGLTRQHAILGASEHCIATHPSDLCVALAALDASVHVTSTRGIRAIAFTDFHRLPGERPDLDNTLAQDELITHIELPEARRFAAHSTYIKLRDRLSYAFALVSVAVALDVDEDGRIREARIALGGVAHKPWRQPDAEAALAGAMPGVDAFARAADALLAGATSQGANDFKIPLARRAIVRALRVAHAGTASNLGHDQGRDAPDSGATP